ncbi:MAG: V-type H+-transporting ATPase subunit a, partial [Streblomastix strix]
GLTATFTVLMYNECFSLSMKLFDSAYTCDELTGNCEKTGRTYWLGFDPIWRQCYNNLMFTNSVKMKISIIVGVGHMIIGIIFSCFNHVHFHKWMEVCCEFIPQILLMSGLFGYLCFMIIYKWIVPPGNSPMLIRTMINMFLSPTEPIAEDEILFKGQGTFQQLDAILIIITIPWMLCIKPGILIYRHMKETKAEKKESDKIKEGEQEKEKENEKQDKNQKKKKGKTFGEGGDADETAHLLSGNKEKESSDTDQLLAGVGDDDGLEEEEFNIGEIFIHQMIETIEFVLGCVSNTASYLRLWALSLAHGQLAEVFFSYAMVKIPSIVPAFGAWAGVSVWLGATLAILTAMEGLSAFLHALRLHWVELQNKFYKAEGYEFVALDFIKLVDDDERAALDIVAAVEAKKDSDST